ncbi:MFS transporter [Streptomyces sp. B21-083]|uniref:MFS transporter n=1 Tax=Streptomyces sp. B21-083 TaxID=3039410 RepID=UPI002FF20F37
MMEPSPSTNARGHPAAVPSRRWSPRLWGLLLVLAGNMLVDALEVSVVIVALPSIGRELDMPLTMSQWLVSGFALGFGGLMLFGGRVVELLGRRRVYLAAMTGFAVASVIGGLTSEPSVLIATRFVKGFCAALTAPTGLAIIASTFPAGRDRDRAVSVYALFGAGGFTAGLLLSGFLTGFSWRWTLLFPAPVVLVLAAFGLRLIPRALPTSTTRHFDIAGASTFAGAVLALVYGITEVPAHGWVGPRTLGAFVLAALLAAAFGTVERTSRLPLFRTGVLRSGTLVRSMLGAAALNGSYLGLLLVATVRLQTDQGWSPLRTALAFLPASAPLAVTALFSGRLVSRFGTARLIAAGALGPLVGCLLYLEAPARSPYATGVLPTMLLVGAGFVLGFAALNMQATQGISVSDRAQAVALYQTAVQLSAALVVALTAALATGASDDRPALWLISAVGAAGLAVGLCGLPRGHHPDSPLRK